MKTQPSTACPDESSTLSPRVYGGLGGDLVRSLAALALIGYCSVSAAEAPAHFGWATSRHPAVQAPMARQANGPSVPANGQADDQAAVRPAASSAGLVFKLPVAPSLLVKVSGAPRFGRSEATVRVEMAFAF